MEHADRVGMFDRVANLLGDVERFHAERVAAEEFAERGPGYVLHRDVFKFGKRAEVVNRDDSGMMEASENLGFAGEALGGIGERGGGAVQDFDGDGAVEAALAGTEDP